MWWVLVLLTLVRPAGGFVYYEQRESRMPPLPQLQSQSRQTVLDLGGPWEFRVGESETWRQGWIPGCFDNDNAVVTFRRSFVLADSLRPRHFQLYIPELHYAAEVWINGTLVSSFVGSHLSFDCHIARELLRFGGPNEIVLRVSNKLTPRTTLPVQTQVFQPRNFGGIFSGVYLRAVPDWSIEDVSLIAGSVLDSTVMGAGARVRIARYAVRAVTDSARTAAVRVTVTLRDSLGRLLAEGRSEPLEMSGSMSFQVVVPLTRFAAALWSPARPVLYTLCAVLGSGTDTLHVLSRRVGIKEFIVRDGQLLLNGQLFRLRGMDYVPDSPRGRRAVSTSLLRSDLSRMKELGINAVRVPFGPPPPSLLDLADDLGFLVLVEMGLDWVPAPVLARTSFRSQVQHTLVRLVSTCRDHVSVLAWGLGSELDWGDPRTLQFSHWLRTQLRELDDRPVYLETARPTDVTGLCDFVLVSRGAERVFSSAEPSRSRPWIVSRIGHLALQRPYTRKTETAALVNQAQFLLNGVLAASAERGSCGFLLHAFADYHGSSPLLNQPRIADPLLYTYGVVDYHRQERIAFAKLRKLEQTGQVASAVPADTMRPPPVTFPLVGLAAILLLSLEMRRNNVFRQNLKRAFLHAHGFYSDLRNRRFLHTAQPVLLVLLEAVALALILAAALYALRTSYMLDYLLTHFLPWPHAKAWLVSVIWNPGQALAFCTALFMVLLALKAVVLRLVGLVVRARMDLWQAGNYVVWSCASLLFLLPVGMLFYRALETAALARFSLVLLAVGLLWTIVRFLTAVRAGLAVAGWRVYAAAFGIGALTIVIVLAVLENRLGTLTYLRFVHHVFAG